MTDRDMEKRDKPKSSAEDGFEARRRLLKASAAAPLVATLMPTASAAAVNTSLNCGVTDFGDTEGLQKSAPFTEAPDAAFRQPEDAIKYVSAKSGLPIVWRIPADTGLYYYYDDLGVLRNDGQDLVEAPGNQYLPPRGTPTAVTVHVVAYFSGTAEMPSLIDFWPNASSGKVLTTSCWTSSVLGDVSAL